MRVRKIDKEGDFCFGNGRHDYDQNTPDAVGSAVMMKLSLWTGTWFTDLADGTPWLGEVLGKYPQAVYDSVIRKRILETPGVTVITEYQSQLDENTRKISVQCTIDTIYGETQFNTVVI